MSRSRAFLFKISPSHRVAARHKFFFWGCWRCSPCRSKRGGNRWKYLFIAFLLCTVVRVSFSKAQERIRRHFADFYRSAAALGRVLLSLSCSFDGCVFVNALSQRVYVIKKKKNPDNVRVIEEKQHTVHGTVKVSEIQYVYDVEFDFVFLSPPARRPAYCPFPRCLLDFL